MTYARIVKLTTLACAAVALGSVSAKAADTVTFKFLDVPTWTNSAIVVKFEGAGNIYAGRYKANLGSKANINIFCTDFTHHISGNESYNTLANLGRVTDPAAAAIQIGGEYYYATGSPGAYVGAGLMSAMTLYDYNPLNLASLNAAQRASAVAYLGDNFLMGNALSKQQYAAVQMAIWDIVQDGGNGLGLGSVKVIRNNQNADGKIAYDYFNSYLNMALAHTQYLAQTTHWIQDGSANKAIDQLSRSAHRQDFLYEGAAPVPEPMTMTLVGIGLGAVAKLRRRRA